MRIVNKPKLPSYYSQIKRKKCIYVENLTVANYNFFILTYMHDNLKNVQKYIL